MGSRCNGVRSANEPQSLQPKIGCQVCEEDRRGGGGGYAARGWLFIRTIGIKRAEAKITLANLAFNMHRMVFHEMPTAAG
jgi:hypothetical protein